jgi:hypothetical protein
LIGIEQEKPVAVFLLTAATGRHNSVVVLVPTDLSLAIPADVAASAGRIRGWVTVILAAIQVEGDSQCEENEKSQQLKNFSTSHRSDLHLSLQCVSS